jgi:formylglycine-generating enzyme required for sulfatase activity
MSAEGRDELGRWAELRVNGVVQRLRWIEPGEFWMGSTEAERKRFGEQGDDDWKKWIQNEAPRHRVKLTQGFWLAETACTQALWQTVAGDNPSHFTGDPNLPVERVSWDDVTQKFLPALNRQLTGVAAVLPTEAQWEYACRAGTETAYHFGEQIHSDQVNYDGNHPPPGGRQGEYRERTVPVKALPANGWGLYQMHGNVLEWCADARRGYTAEPVEDPDGGQDGVGRVLRGGAWYFGARFARSAIRFEDPRDYRDVDFGFRFALRSIEPGAGGR